MKKLLTSVLFLCCFICAIENTISGRIIGVSDGDTVTLLTSDKRQIKVRLNGVDCPEKNQAYGTRANQFTSDLVFNKLVTVKITDIDRYGRTVGEVILQDGQSLNRELIRAGFAWHYKQYSKDKALAELETEARKAGKGLWAESTPISPWEFRRGTREHVQSATDGGAPVSINTVLFNVKSLKYHCHNCPAAARCTRNCIEIPTAEVQGRGGVACKVCGGCR